MNKKEKKPLMEELLNAVNKVLKTNKATLTKKFEKVVMKSIKKIVKKNKNQIKKTSKIKP